MIWDSQQLITNGPVEFEFEVELKFETAGKLLNIYFLFLFLFETDKGDRSASKHRRQLTT